MLKTSKNTSDHSVSESYQPFSLNQPHLIFYLISILHFSSQSQKLIQSNLYYLYISDILHFKEYEIQQGGNVQMINTYSTPLLYMESTLRLVIYQEQTRLCLLLIVGWNVCSKEMRMWNYSNCIPHKCKSFPPDMITFIYDQRYNCG